jgi:lipopolysaccharide assembly outer membrane protein LptD (OstA)
MYRGLISIFFLLCVAFISAQKKTSPKLIRIIQAESFSFDSEKTDAQILKGNVICEHEGTFLNCDTAYFYEKQNRIIATGHILITKGDSIRITGEKLNYDGKTKLATLQKNVRCVEKDMVLTTELLTFDLARSIASYYNGGTIVNKDNTLVSKNGHYYSSSKEASFHYDVVLTNPEYKMNSDTLRYRIPSKTAYFLGPSIITSKNDYIYCENGWYDTNFEKAQFSKNAVLVTSQQRLRGDSLFYDRAAQIGRAYRNVTLVDTAQKSIIYGDYVEYHQLRSEALITKKPLYVRIINEDSLFVAADTLYHIDVDSVDNFLNAYHHVRIYKKDLQAISDSATLNTRDSVMQLYNLPVLWSGDMQATSKIIKVDIGKNEIKGFTLDGKAFLMEQLDTANTDKFNQLTGRIITGVISADTVRRVKATGSAEIYYYPENKGKAVGLNKTTTNEVTMWFKLGDANRVSMKPKTDGNIYPLKEVDFANAKLKGFNWQPDRRPRSRFDLHPKRKSQTP